MIRVSAYFLSDSVLSLCISKVGKRIQQITCPYVYPFMSRLSWREASHLYGIRLIS